jgi:hypothetical protein
MIGAASVTITDASGNSVSPLSDIPNTKLVGVTSYELGERSLLFVTDTDQTYTITLRSDAQPIEIELIKGTDVTTTEAVRYQDLSLPAGVTAMYKVTPQGIEVLRYDKDGDGTFETPVNPTASLSGLEAQDTEPPVITLGETRQQGGTLVNLTAADSASGVKAVYYSLDGTKYQAYTSAFTVDPYKTPIVYTFADDKVANRSGLITFQLTAPASTLQFSIGTYSVGESEGKATITVTRTGDTSGAAKVRYATRPDAAFVKCDVTGGAASERCDYSTTVGVLRFAAGEQSKTFVVPISDDVFVEGSELVNLVLSNSVGVSLGEASTATLMIQDNDSAVPTDTNNPFLSNPFFVKQQYLDFLNREPDTGGFTAWLNVLNDCGPAQGGLGSPVGCDKVHVSSGFYRSPEFTDRGYFVYRFYEASLGRLPKYTEFVPDVASLSGFASEQEQQQNISDFIAAFMQRGEFFTRYTGLTTTAASAAQFVAKLEQTTGVTLPETIPQQQPNQPPQYTRTQLISRMSGGQATAEQTLRAFVEQQVIYDKFFFRGFVAMQYFGYLRRDPDMAGYNDWVDVLENGRASAGIQKGNYRHLIFGFLYAPEYRERFGKP